MRLKILALDTATEACSAALLMDGRLITREAEFDRGHAEHILSMVDAVLVEAGVSLADVDAVAFGRGPGAFTGVRLAASVTQGLAFAADRRIVPISDLAALAQRALDVAPGIDRVLVCSDARMQEVYWACFERRPGAQSESRGVAALVGAEHVGRPGTVELPLQWRVGASAGAIGAVGRGFRAYAELRSRLLSEIDGRPPIAELISDTLLPRAEEVARLAVIEVDAGRTLPPDQAIPVYLRDDVARPPSSRN